MYVISKFSDQYGILCIMYKTLSFVECVWMTHLRGHLWRGNIHSVLISGMYYLPRRGFFLACFKQLLSCACGLSVPYSVCLHHFLRHKETHYATDKPSINWLCKYEQPCQQETFASRVAFIGALKSADRGYFQANTNTTHIWIPGLLKGKILFKLWHFSWCKWLRDQKSASVLNHPKLWLWQKFKWNWSCSLGARKDWDFQLFSWGHLSWYCKYELKIHDSSRTNCS